MFYPSCLRSPENITCPSLILIRAQNWPKPWWSPRACSAEHILSPNLGGLRIWAFSAAHGLHSLNRPQTHLCTKVHSETSFTLTSLDTSRFWVPVTLYQWCPNLFASQLWYRTAVCAEPVSFQCRKKGVVFWCNDWLSCLDASVYHTVHPLAALLVSQPSRPRLHIPTQSSRFTVSDCKEFLCSGSARSLSAEKSFLCHYQWLHPPAEESSYHAPYH